MMELQVGSSMGLVIFTAIKMQLGQLFLRRRANYTMTVRQQDIDQRLLQPQRLRGASWSLTARN
jgi:hypothetical protein